MIVVGLQVASIVVAFLSLIPNIFLFRAAVFPDSEHRDDRAVWLQDFLLQTPVILVWVVAFVHLLRYFRTLPSVLDVCLFFGMHLLLFFFQALFLMAGAKGHGVKVFRFPGFASVRFFPLQLLAAKSVSRRFKSFLPSGGAMYESFLVPKIERYFTLRLAISLVAAISVVIAQERNFLLMGEFNAVSQCIFLLTPGLFVFCFMLPLAWLIAARCFD